MGITKQSWKQGRRATVSQGFQQTTRCNQAIKAILVKFSFKTFLLSRLGCHTTCTFHFEMIRIRKEQSHYPISYIHFPRTSLADGISCTDDDGVHTYIHTTKLFNCQIPCCMKLLLSFCNGYVCMLVCMLLKKSKFSSLFLQISQQIHMTQKNIHLLLLPLLHNF